MTLQYYCMEIVLAAMKLLTRSAWIIALFTILMTANYVSAQDLSSKADDLLSMATVEKYCIGDHDVGRLVFGITNFGMAGIGENNGVTIDCFTGYRVKYGEYPKGSGNSHFYKGGLWVGGVIGNDTLVSTGAQLNNSSREFHPIEPMIKRSTLNPFAEGYNEAVSELDYIGVYADTFTSGVSNLPYDAVDQRLHRPLGLEVNQRSFSWSYPHTDDFIIIEYNIKNIGGNYIKDVFVGVYWDVDIHSGGIDLSRAPDPYGRKANSGGNNDMGGFIYSVPSFYKDCEYSDSIYSGWTIDANGVFSSALNDFTLPNVVGICLLNSPKPWHKVGFNWWSYNYNPAYDIGPQSREHYRYMGNGTGTPIGDRNMYAMMSNGEIDFDAMYTYSIQPVDPYWLEPSKSAARTVSRGLDFQYVLSLGPYDMPPGSDITVPIAFVGGEGVHTDRNSYYYNLSRFYNPDKYRNNLDFSDYIKNIQTARKVYDIPGKDTDGDGFAGKFNICDFDTTYYEGDGKPDFAAANPPPAPKTWLIPTQNGLLVRFNGYDSENSPDLFSGKIDFEGYNVYIARDNREESFSLLTSYDVENYDKYTYTDDLHDVARFQVMDEPFTREELRCLYGFTENPCADSNFVLERYSYHDPYVLPDYPDSIFYFKPHFFNCSQLGVTTKIRKRYPDEPRPDSVENLLPEQLTDDGYPKYYDYEILIGDLLPSVPYYVAVTAFDIGSPSTGLQSLESSVLLAAKSAYPNNSWDFKPNEIGNVYVYPNPYRQDAWYRIYGFEGLGQEDQIRNRVRKVTFANLPAKCTIRILSIDGDLIREIDHNMDASDPNSSYQEWDLISRNVQMIVSGLYYWVVEDEKGNSQIGKLVILL